MDNAQYRRKIKWNFRRERMPDLILCFEQIIHIYLLDWRHYWHKKLTLSIENVKNKDDKKDVVKQSSIFPMKRCK